jgi:peptide chain release factor 1
VPAALLTRARDVALEHKQLTDKLANGFDTRTAKKVGEYSPIVNALGDWDKANEVSGHAGRRSDSDQMC